eukprot:gnl/TRDRNA2_/TRDRNA2_204633_c0_seq1.p1 gnl/TRDRNA2_/TRDRNA2_204633_c0~~gnl/TRDRNA2_/TRDRNA2_204633_c0_seq1.p1  ORF type:complete len:177 (-),score=10.18 gnl/TRDRNA2_/TRDRNA2_204633_c0_seq1:21-551(-)
MQKMHAACVRMTLCMYLPNGTILYPGPAGKCSHVVILLARSARAYPAFTKMADLTAWYIVVLSSPPGWSTPGPKNLACVSKLRGVFHDASGATLTFPSAQSNKTVPSMAILYTFGLAPVGMRLIATLSAPISLSSRSFSFVLIPVNQLPQCDTSTLTGFGPAHTDDPMDLACDLEY